MAYAITADVLARAGELAAAFTSTSHPNLDEIDGFCVAESAMIDTLLASRGITTPVDGDAAEVFRAVAADGALLIALPARFPGGESPNPAVQRLIDVTLARYTSAWKSLGDGTNPTLVGLSETSGSETGASDFWTEEPDYNLYGSSSVRSAVAESPYIQPYLARGMKF